MASPFSSAEVLRHRHGIHQPRVMLEDGIITMMGRQLRVDNPVQLEADLRRIGCNEEVVRNIVGGIFGYATPREIWEGVRVEGAGDD